MLRLGIDASTPHGSVALSEGAGLLAESLLPPRAGGSEALLPEVEHLLASCGRGIGELGGVVAGAGPGSFTGVRIAAALAKGLCEARDVPLFAYSSLLATAVGSGLQEKVCAVFDARRGQLYAAAYGTLDPPTAVFGPAVLGPDELLEALEGPAEWSLVGQGATLYAERFEALGARVLPAFLGPPRAAALLWLAARWPELGRVERAADWEPEYVRRSDAERAAGASFRSAARPAALAPRGRAGAGRDG